MPWKKTGEAHIEQFVYEPEANGSKKKDDGGGALAGIVLMIVLFALMRGCAS